MEGSSIHPLIIGDFSRADLRTWKVRWVGRVPAVRVPFSNEGSTGSFILYQLSALLFERVLG